MFENVSWGELNFTELVNMIIDFVLKVVNFEFPELGEIMK